MAHTLIKMRNPRFSLGILPHKTGPEALGLHVVQDAAKGECGGEGACGRHVTHSGVAYGIRISMAYDARGVLESRWWEEARRCICI